MYYSTTGKDSYSDDQAGDESKQAEPVGRPLSIGTPGLGENTNEHSTSNYQNVHNSISYESFHPGYLPWQLPTPPYSPHGLLGLDNRAETLQSHQRGDFLQSMFSLALPSDPLNQVSQIPQNSGLVELPTNTNSEELEDPEGIQVAVVGSLSLDRNVESNGLPFILQAYALWLSKFWFEPLRVSHWARNNAFRGYTLGEDSRQLLNLLANNVHEVVRSAEYDPAKSPVFAVTEAVFRQRLQATAYVEPSRDQDRQYANQAVLLSNQWITLLYTVGSLSSVLDFMQLVAPVFRRACPDPLDRFVNLPTLLTTMNVALQHYAMMDVLLGVLTGWPMFFRYSVDFTPAVPESLFSCVDAPGMRWTYGIPDRLMMMFAQMNGLLEDFGPHVPKHVTDILEEEIKHMKPIIGPSTEPHLSVGRMMVQEAWFQAALIYLYMGLCGSDSTDRRVVTVRSRFMKLLASVKPKRNPDSFLVLPLVILGVTTDRWEERSIIRQRMLGVPECCIPGRTGNDFVRILENIWSKRLPVVWNDFRQACWEIAGV